MASNSPVAALARISRHASSRALRVSRAAFSTSQKLHGSAPLLATIKADIKTAMRAKDAPRLSVLRAVLSASNEAEKQDKEIKDDAQVIAILQKQEKSMKQALEEAQKANRPDLVEKEEAHIKVVEEYVAKADLGRALSEEEIRELLRTRVAELKTEGLDSRALGATMRAETGKLAWAPEGTHVNRKEAFAILDQVLKEGEGTQ